MPTSAPGTDQGTDCRTRLSPSGFTLLELLVTLVIISLVSGLLVVTGAPSDSRYLESEAKRLAQILRIAHQEALLTSTRLRLITGQRGFAFETELEDKWVPIEDKTELRPREWNTPGIEATLFSEGRPVSALVLEPRRGLVLQQVRLQYRQSVLLITSESAGLYIMGQPVQLDVTAGGSAR